MVFIGRTHRLERFVAIDKWKFLHPFPMLIYVWDSPSLADC